MKLAVVCSSNRLDSLPRLRDVLDGLFIESLAWYPKKDATREESLDGLERCLDYSPYVLCIADRESPETNWFHYTVGYQRGRTDRLTFWFPPGDAGDIPDFLNRYAVIPGDESDIRGYIAEVRDSWSEEAKVVQAVRTLSENDIEHSARTFVEAVQAGDRFVMGLFLEAGFSPSLRDGAGVPVLSHAIRSGHLGLVDPLLDAGADVNGIAEDRGTTPLMDAAAGGHQGLVRRFIELGADLEHESKDGQTAIILAVGNGKDEAAVELIRGGSDPDKTDLLGMSARKYAKLYGLDAILAAMDERPSASD